MGVENYVVWEWECEGVGFPVIECGGGAIAKGGPGGRALAGRPGRSVGWRFHQCIWQQMRQRPLNAGVKLGGLLRLIVGTQAHYRVSEMLDLYVCLSYQGIFIHTFEACSWLSSGLDSLSQSLLFTY